MPPISIHALLAESDLIVVLLWYHISKFLSTLSLRRATAPDGLIPISTSYFYPRSPCGERLPITDRIVDGLEFLSTLSLRRATEHLSDRVRLCLISIHALLAESDTGSVWSSSTRYAFLSTLSLRRATIGNPLPRQGKYYFYPRSPCGERLVSTVP